MADIQFVEGLRFYPPNERAPDFIKANLVIEPRELIAWIGNRTDKIRIDLKESRQGKLYLAVNDYKPKTDGPRQALEQPQQPADMGGFDDDVPFSQERILW